MAGQKKERREEMTDNSIFDRLKTFFWLVMSLLILRKDEENKGIFYK